LRAIAWQSLNFALGNVLCRDCHAIARNDGVVNIMFLKKSRLYIAYKSITSCIYETL
jgi:hypothetical protein